MWQSPTTITLHTIIEPVALYFIASLHGQCSYMWRRVGDDTTELVYPSAPVIYVTEPGLYQCIAKHGISKALGKIISLPVDAG